MSNRERVLQRLETAVAGLEAAAERRISSAAQAMATQDADMQDKLKAVVAERDGLATEVEEQSRRNAELGARLDNAIAKLNTVLESA